MAVALQGLRTVIYPSPGGIVTATVRTPPGAILGLIYNPGFAAR